MYAARAMRCRPSEVDEEDADDVNLWLIADRVEAMVRERAQRRAQSRAANRGRR